MDNNALVEAFAHSRYSPEAVLSQNDAIFVIKARDTIAQKEVTVKGFRKPLTGDEARLLRRACHVHTTLHHQGIIGFVEVFNLPNYIGVSMPYFPGTNVREYVMRLRHPMPHTDAHTILRHVVYALSYMHNRDVAYRLLKPEHVLLQPHGHGRFTVKLVDFLYARPGASVCRSKVGSPHHAPPEIVDAPVAVVNGEYDGKKVDVWGCGVLLYYMLYAVLPFTIPPNGLSEFDRMHLLVEMIREEDVQFPENVAVPSQYRNLIDRMLAKDPEKRISIDEILELDWFNHGYEMNADNNDDDMFSQTAEQIDRVIREATINVLI